MKREIEFLKNNISPSSYVIVACSGGPDSMCLLSLINSLKMELDLKIIVAHVNHKLREESEEEAQMVKDYATKNNLIFELLELNEYKTEVFKESDGRNKRYDFFKMLASKYNAKYILTAHHGDDLIETILMRITRGSNLSGYIGIRDKTSNNDYFTLRPLLTATKEEILKYLINNDVPYRIDKTNDTFEHTRNRYRLSILPFLKKENPKVDEKFLEFSKELIEYDNFVNNYIIKNNFIVDNSVVVNKVKNEDTLIKRKCLELLIKMVQKNDYFDVSREQLNNLMKLYNNENISVDLNNNYQGFNSYGKIFIKKRSNKVFEEVIINSDIELEDYIFYYNTKDSDNTNNCICLSSSEIELPLKLRSYQHGDKIKIKNLNGTKKISDIFIDSKVPKYKRDTYPLLVDAKNNILWVPNLKKSQFSKDKSEKCDIIIKCEAKEK